MGEVLTLGSLFVCSPLGVSRCGASEKGHCYHMPCHTLGEWGHLARSLEGGGSDVGDSHPEERQG